MALTALPRRDEEARASLEFAARRAQPVVLAGQRVLPLTGELGDLLPDAALRRGAVVAVDGEPGSGATTIALRLAAAATDAGEWVAAVELHASLGGLAAQAAGVALERLAVVRWVPPARWAAVVAALVDGIGLVVAEVPAHARASDARRLTARARERGTVLVAMGPWPAEASLRLRAEGSAWRGGEDAGLLAGRELRVRVEGRGEATRARVGALATGSVG